MIRHPILAAPIDFEPNCTLIELNFQVYLFPNREEWTTNKTYLVSSNLTFYTDESLINGHSGAGIFSSHPEIKVSISLGQYSSVFQADTYAISVCVKHCLDENYHRKSIDICSDSQAALKALSSIKFRSKLVLECRQFIMRLAESNTVGLIWALGHHDIQGNKIAD